MVITLESGILYFLFFVRTQTSLFYVQIFDSLSLARGRYF